MSELADRLTIVDIVATYCCRLDEYDVQAAAAVFAEDGVLDLGPTGGLVEGRAAIAERLAVSQGRYRRSHHQVGQVEVDLDGDRAHAEATVTSWYEAPDGSRSTLRGRYVDDLRRGADGWRVARRELWVNGAEGFGEVEWRWVPRRTPS